VNNGASWRHSHLQCRTRQQRDNRLLPHHVNQVVREAATICRLPLQVDLWPFDLECDVWVTCDVGYLCANFSLPRPLCSRLRPDVRDRQTSDRQTLHVRQMSDAHHRLMPPPYGGGGITSNSDAVSSSDVASYGHWSTCSSAPSSTLQCYLISAPHP